MASQLPEGCTRLFAGIRNSQIAGVFNVCLSVFPGLLFYPPCLVDSVVLCVLASVLLPYFFFLVFFYFILLFFFFLPYFYTLLRAEGVKRLRL